MTPQPTHSIPDERSLLTALSYDLLAPLTSMRLGLSLLGTTDLDASGGDTGSVVDVVEAQRRRLETLLRGTLLLARSPVTDGAPSAVELVSMAHDAAIRDLAEVDLRGETGSLTSGGADAAALGWARREPLRLALAAALAAAQPVSAGPRIAVHLRPGADVRIDICPEGATADASSAQAGLCRLAAALAVRAGATAHLPVAGEPWCLGIAIPTPAARGEGE